MQFDSECLGALVRWDMARAAAAARASGRAWMLRVGIGYLVPGVEGFMNRFQVGTTNIPIAPA